MKLINGECISVMQDLINEDVTVDAIITDLPYGVTDNQWDNIIPFNEMWECIKHIRKDKKTPVVFFAQQPFSSKLVMSKLKWYRHEWIYQKRVGSNFGIVKYQPMKEHEEILVFSEKTPYYYPIKEERKGGGKDRIKYGHNLATKTTNLPNSLKKHVQKKQEKLRHPGTVRYYNNRSKGNVGLHPNQKPVELLEYLVQTYTKENDTVLDFTMGSGTCGVACLNTNRDFIGIELEKKYYDIATERLKNYQTRLI